MGRKRRIGIKGKRNCLRLDRAKSLGFVEVGVEVER